MLPTRTSSNQSTVLTVRVTNHPPSEATTGDETNAVPTEPNNSTPLDAIARNISGTPVSLIWSPSNGFAQIPPIAATPTPITAIPIASQGASVAVLGPAPSIAPLSSAAARSIAHMTSEPSEGDLYSAENGNSNASSSSNLLSINRFASLLAPEPNRHNSTSIVAPPPAAPSTLSGAAAAQPDVPPPPATLLRSALGPLPDIRTPVTLALAPPPTGEPRHPERSNIIDTLASRLVETLLPVTVQLALSRAVTIAATLRQIDAMLADAKTIYRLAKNATNLFPRSLSSQGNEGDETLVSAVGTLAKASQHTLHATVAFLAYSDATARIHAACFAQMIFPDMPNTRIRARDAIIHAEQHQKQYIERLLEPHPTTASAAEHSDAHSAKHALLKTIQENTAALAKQAQSYSIDARARLATTQPHTRKAIHNMPEEEAEVIDPDVQEAAIKMDEAAILLAGTARVTAAAADTACLALQVRLLPR